jgi:DNA-binding transcriptional ArsR family regulator
MLSSMAVSLFEVVAEPHRRQILDALRARDRAVNDLVALLGLAQPTVSKHLKALRDAELVVVRPEAQRRWYQLRPERLQELDAWLEPYRRTWSDRLDALGAHLDHMEVSEVEVSEVETREMETPDE